MIVTTKFSVISPRVAGIVTVIGLPPAAACAAATSVIVTTTCPFSNTTVIHAGTPLVSKVTSPVAVPPGVLEPVVAGRAMVIPGRLKLGLAVVVGVVVGGGSVGPVPGGVVGSVGPVPGGVVVVVGLVPPSTQPHSSW